MNEKGRDVRVFVAEDRSGELGGVIALEPVNEYRWEVDAVGVSVDHRRKGIANALTKFAVASTPARRGTCVHYR